MTPFYRTWRDSTPAERRCIFIAELRKDQHGHEWNYCTTCGCAIGLFAKLADKWQDSIELAADLDLTDAQRLQVFFDAEQVVGKRFADVTAADVAAVLESLS